ncbi:hypothetical protein L1987_48175 [Smallanthus sonchifolius]|uniref:Uncharacterized protein n=1 Tax=Smallanthus sonchifolius TaxID=185202 RepID=A0ACB9FS48_9ASTR|nr:hypothetical protein L1987_48175 [Smallanthus sonchifolius]
MVNMIRGSNGGVKGCYGSNGGVLRGIRRKELSIRPRTHFSGNRTGGPDRMLVMAKVGPSSRTRTEREKKVS